MSHHCEWSFSNLLLKLKNPLSEYYTSEGLHKRSMCLTEKHLKFEYLWKDHPWAG